MRKIFYIFLNSCLIFTIISCGKSTEENVNDTVSKTSNNVEGVVEDNNDTVVDLEDAISGGGSGNQSQCTSVRTFQKKLLSGRQAKQTNDCGYIVASHAGNLTKLNVLGEIIWETKITLKQRKHSNLGKPSVIQTSDGGYLYSDNDGIGKVSSSGEIEWKYINQNNRAFEDAIEHSNGFFYLVSDDLVAHGSKAKVYKFNSKGKRIWRKPFGGGCSREKLRSILESSDGELIIVGGKSHGNNKFPCTFEFYDDAWIIKVDADNGGKIWEKTYGGRNYEHFEDIVRNPNGGYYAIGTACNKKNPPWGGDYCAKNKSALWMKFDDNGNSLGKKHFTHGPNQTGFSITNTSSGGTAWVGQNKKLVGSKYKYKAIFYKLTGTTVNYSTVVDLGGFDARSIELTKDGGFIIVAGNNVIKTDSDMRIPTLEK